MEIAKCKRIDEIDILKALGIICMVAGHSRAPFSKFVYLFHMAVFFTASGFFYREKTASDIKSVSQGLLTKIRQLWLPFVIWTAIYVCLHNVFISINVYTDNPLISEYVTGAPSTLTAYYTIPDMLKGIAKGAIFSCSEQIFGACWFLKVLFLVSVGYLVADFLVRLVFKKHVLLIQCGISTVLLGIGYYCSLKGNTYFGIAQAASFYFLYYAGHLLGMYREKYENWNWKHFLPILLVSFSVLLFLNTKGTITLDRNQYTNPLFFILASFFGWVFLYSLSYFIKKVPGVCRVMIGIGKRTLPVLILHFLCMKLVAIAVAAYYGLPDFCVAAFPNLYGERGSWWIAYTIVGVGLPVALSMLYELAKGKVKGIKKKQVLES